MWFVELFRSLAWPLLIAWALWYFRSEIRKLLSREFEVGLKGVRVGPPAQEATQVTDIAVDRLPTSTAQQVPPFIQTISGDQLGPVIDAFSKTAPPNSSDADKARYFLVTAAALHIQLQHERHYIAMFGSQIALLKRLNEVGPIGLSIDMAQLIYNEAARNYPDIYKSYSFEQWLNFLLHTGLVMRQENKLTITPYGNGFLQYIVLRQLSEIKAF